MFHHIVSVSSVCLLLAFAGWDKEKSDSFPEYILDPPTIETYSTRYSTYYDNTWIWPFDFLSREPEPCFCWGFFQCLDCLSRNRDQLEGANIFTWLLYKTVYNIEDVGIVVDGLAIGFLWSKKETQDNYCQKNSNLLNKMRRLERQHRAELEEMARTIEYLHQVRRKQKMCLEQRDVEVDTLQNAIRHMYHAHAEGDTGHPSAQQMENDHFTDPDFEWD